MTSEDSPDINADRVGIFMDVLDNIIHDLNDNERLQQIFGTPVDQSLVVVADGNDLRIEQGPHVPLSEDDAQTWMKILGEVIQANSI